MKEHKYIYSKISGGRVFINTMMKYHTNFLIFFCVLFIGSLSYALSNDYILVSGIGIGVSIAYFSKLMINFKQTTYHFNQQIGKEHILRLSDDYFEIQSENMTSRYKWRAIKEIWKNSDVWAFCIEGRSAYLFMPNSNIPEDILAEIEKKTILAGGAISA